MATKNDVEEIKDPARAFVAALNEGKNTFSALRVMKGRRGVFVTATDREGNEKVFDIYVYKGVVA